MIVVILAVVSAAIPLCFAIETVGRPPGQVDRRGMVLAARSCAFLMIGLFWFSIVWRPFLAVVAMLLTVAVLRAVSAMKRRLVGEPLVFSDFALLRQVVRHPDLYYLDARAVVVAVVIACPVAAWIWVEPALLPRRWAAAWTLVAVVPLVQIGLALALRRTARITARLWMPRPDLARDEARFGLCLTLLAYLARWSACRRGLAPAPRAGLVPAAVPTPRTVVVVQLESFVDPVVLPGGRTGPHLARARAMARLAGALHVPGHGAYTMRSEFAVLSGLDPEEIAFEGFDPYLSVADRPFDTLAKALGRRRYRTVFVHPFRRGFFGRDRVMPALGFDRLVMEDDFAGAERVGPHVSDAAVARRILAEVDAAAGPVLVFAATMQNHGPWTVELSPAAGSPLERYRRHLDDADRMIGQLIDGLEARRQPALLCVYGDHPPILDAVGPPSSSPVTTYAVVGIGIAGTGERCDLSAAGLGRVVRALAGA